MSIYSISYDDNPYAKHLQKKNYLLCKINIVSLFIFVCEGCVTKMKIHLDFLYI